MKQSMLKRALLTACLSVSMAGVAMAGPVGLSLIHISDMGLDQLNGSGVVLIGAAMGDDKVNFVCKVSKDVVAKGAKAGNIVKAAAQVAGGNGGGRPDMAQAGGKEPAKLMEALKAGGEALTSMLQQAYNFIIILVSVIEKFYDA